MEPLRWPPLSVACALLPVIRGEILSDARAPRADDGPMIDVCAIVEDGMFGYELAPHVDNLPFIIVGCTEDNIPRLRRTTFDPNGESGLRLATLQGRRLSASRPHLRRSPRQEETLYSDWTTAAGYAWDHLAPAMAHPGPQWEVAMHACRALENALTIASLHLAQWDPAIEFCGLTNQAEYGLPLRGRDGGSGALTFRSTEPVSADLPRTRRGRSHEGSWLLTWKVGAASVRHEFSTQVRNAASPADLSRNARG